MQLGDLKSCSDPFFCGQRASLSPWSSIVSIVFVEVTPLAVAGISWRYCAVFVAINLLGTAFFFFLPPGTGGKILEEVAELFGNGLEMEHLGDIDG